MPVSSESVVGMTPDSMFMCRSRKVSDVSLEIADGMVPPRRLVFMFRYVNAVRDVNTVQSLALIALTDKSRYLMSDIRHS